MQLHGLGEMKNCSWKSFGTMALALLVLPFFGFGQKLQTPLAGNAQVWEGKAIVKLKPGHEGAFAQPGPELAAVLTSLSASVSPMFPDLVPAQPRMTGSVPDLRAVYTLEFPGHIPVEEAVSRLRQVPDFAYAEPWILHELFYQPNDPLADTTQGVDYQWHLDAIFARQAWDLRRNDTSVVVGVIDTGVSFQHPDLQQNLQINRLDLPDGQDNDGDGYTDNYRGWDFGGPVLGGPGDNDPSEAGHGVGVIGSFAATADNGIGAAGVCFNCRYIPVKAIADDRPELVAFGYQGVLYTAMKGADVINCSWGSTFNSEFGQDVVKFVTTVYGAAIVAAAGNSQKDETFYPAGYPEVISVANSTYGDVICCNSTFNFTVDVSAPGFDILSPVGNDGYFGITGTSFAAPVASGAVALVKAHFPHYSGFQAAQRLRVTTDGLYGANPGLQDKLGTGRINLFRALTDPARPSVRRVSHLITDLDGDGRFLGGDTLLLDLRFFNYLEGAQNLTVSAGVRGFPSFYLTPIDTLTPYGAIAANSPLTSPSLFRFRLHPGVPADFEFNLRITYTDSATGYNDFEYLTFSVNRSYLDVRENQLHTSVNGVGNIGFNDFITNRQGLGVRYANSANALFESGFLIGNGPARVSDRIRNANFQDQDFAVVEKIGPEEGPADLTISATFDDRNAANPLGVEVKQYTYAFHNLADQNYILFEYQVQNQGSSALNGLYAGMFADWDMVAGNQNLNVSDYNEAAKLAYAYDLGNASRNYYGYALLSDEPFHAYANLSTGPFSYSSQAKFEALSSPVSPALSRAGFAQGGADVMNFVSGGPFNLAAGETRRIAFAMVAGRSPAELVTARQAALQRYRCDILGLRPDKLFTISDSLPRTGMPVSFTDQNPSATAWAWDMGDGTRLTGPSVSHTYTQAGTYRVILTVQTPDCPAEIERLVQVDASLSLDDVSRSSVFAYPNPFTHTLRVHSSSPVSAVYLTDLAGRKVTAWEVTGPERLEVKLETAGLSPGLYVLNIVTAAGQSGYLVSRARE